MNSAEQFEVIVTKHYEPLFRFAMSLTRSESDAGDLTQQTFLVWATKGHQLRDLTKIKPWLFTTLHRAFLAARRRQTRFPQCELDDVTHELPAPSPGPATPADCSLVLPALARVDEVYQAAVALFYLDDCSYNDIAAILEVPLGTVKSRIARGIAQLREILCADDSGETPPSRNGISSRPQGVGSAARRKHTLTFPRHGAPPTATPLNSVLRSGTKVPLAPRNIRTRHESYMARARGWRRQKLQSEYEKSIETFPATGQFSRIHCARGASSGDLRGR